jgi:hypothetical protein
MANTERGKIRCPYTSPPLSVEENEAEWHQCIDGELVIYDVKTFKEIRREYHDLCNGTGMMQR